MPEKERLEAIDRVIDALKKKEKEERDKEQEAAVEAALQKQGAQGNTGNRNQKTPTTNQQPGLNTNGQWYFYNQMAVNQGKQTFQKQWGKRENVDDWQRVNKTVVGNLTMPGDTDNLDNPDNLDNMENPDSLAMQEPTDSLAVEPTDSLANDPHNREYYLAQIPFTEEAKEASDLLIMDGLFNSGVIFKDKLENFRLAEKQFNRLTTQYPTFQQMDQAWYHLFLLHSRMGRTNLADSCLAHLKADYPESELTILLTDPYFEENARFGEHLEDSIYGVTYDAFKDGRHDVIQANAKLSAERFPLGENRPKFIFINGLSLLNQGDAKGCVEELKTVVEKYPQSEVSEMAGMIIKGVQEGRTLHGGTFDLDAVWSRRDVSLDADSVGTDTLSADRDVPFLFILVYQPDSLQATTADGRVTSGENQLLYEMARFNFSNFLVRNFDLEVEREPGVSRMLIRGFLSFDEALQYARQLYDSEPMAALLRQCRSLVISEHNLTLIGTRYSYKDYDEFYEQVFQPLQISNEELLSIPTELPEPEDEENTGDNGEDTQQPTPASTDDFDPDFW